MCRFFTARNFISSIFGRLPLFSLDDTLRNIQESTWETYGSKPKSFAAEQKFGNGVDADEWNMQRKIVVSKESKGVFILCSRVT